MIKRSVEELINTYLTSGKPALDRKLKKLSNNATTSKEVLKMHSIKEDVINEFLEKEKGIQHKLSLCTSYDDLSDLANKTFGTIKGIGERTINSWVLHRAYSLDIDPESDCFSCLCKNGRDYVAKQSITKDTLVKHIKSLHKDFHSINYIEMADFINYADKKKMLTDIMPE